MNTSAAQVDGEASFYPEANASDGPWSENNTEDFEYDMPPSVADLPIPILYCLVCVVGLLGNSLVIFIIVRHVKMRTVTNIYILNLALADGLFMLGLPFLAMQVALQRWPLCHFMCKLVMILDGINQFTSVFGITMMSLDRYVAVVHPIISSRWRSPSLAKKVSVILWLISFMPVIPMAIYSGVDDTSGICTLMWPEPTSVWRTAFVVSAFVLGFALPFTVISLCYILLLVKIKATVGSSQSPESVRSEKKITVMVVAIVVVFAVCWLPFYTINICVISSSISWNFSLRSLFEFTVVLSYFNSCANPILYVCLSKSFGRAFQMLLCPRLVLRAKSAADRQTADLTETQPTVSGGELESVLR
ncbi:somatostatin receptor type 2-like [Pristis pectinata]|uniref:somatostatin receptor type 2-like n=1 Tax=Pristis pectinata TaxID=685728 RepID=UPI00223E846F|nr:somatostatin receptor type 2-like [Pristis pectinata]